MEPYLEYFKARVWKCLKTVQDRTECSSWFHAVVNTGLSQACIVNESMDIQ